MNWPRGRLNIYRPRGQLLRTRPRGAPNPERDPGMGQRLGRERVAPRAAEERL